MAGRGSLGGRGSLRGLAEKVPAVEASGREKILQQAVLRCLFWLRGIPKYNGIGIEGDYLMFHFVAYNYLESQIANVGKVLMVLPLGWY